MRAGRPMVTLRRIISLRVLVGLQLAAILVLAGVTVLRFHVWAAVDEPQHYANVQSIAEDGRYPLQDDVVAPAVESIAENVFPRRPRTDPRTEGLGGLTYEAVQPPLYYLLATPAFLVPVDHRRKVFVLRLFDLALLMLALGLSAALCRAVLGPRWLAGFSAVAAVFLWPGVLVRMITISNDVLAIPVSLLFAWLVVRAWQARSPGRLVVAGGALGGALLVKATLEYLVPVLLAAGAGALRWSTARARLAGPAALAVTAALVAPWLVANAIRYHHFGLVGGRPEVAALYGTDPHLIAGGLGSRLARLTLGSLPQEFSPVYAAGLGEAVTRLLVLALVAFGAVGALVARRRLAAMDYAVLGLPLVTGVLGMVAEYEHGGLDAFFGRYLYSAAVLFALFGAVAWIKAGAERVTVAWAAGTSSVAAGVWVHLAAAYYFTDLGRRLGLA